MAYSIASRQPIQGWQGAKIAAMLPRCERILAPASGAAPSAILRWSGSVAELQIRPIVAMERKMRKKGYWIAHVNITNPERYQDYIAANAIAFAKYNARFLVRAGQCVVAKGDLEGHRHVVIEFESYAVARACYESPEYQAAAKIRDEASEAQLVIIEGYAP
jgi:uncharacterized protein (DUF1330 family)